MHDEHCVLQRHCGAPLWKACRTQLEKYIHIPAMNVINCYVNLNEAPFNCYFEDCFVFFTLCEPFKLVYIISELAFFSS